MGEERNFDRIQFEKYRRVVDAKYNEAHDLLTEAYYKFWKLGNSKPWRGYDVQATPEESKALFDKLHGAIFVEHALAIDAEHKATEKKDQDPAYERAVKVPAGKPLPPAIDKVIEAEAKRAALAAEGIAVNI